jgi:hypothetical protein
MAFKALGLIQLRRVLREHPPSVYGNTNYDERGSDKIFLGRVLRPTQAE